MKEIIKKWYYELKFPEKYDAEFLSMLSEFTCNIPHSIDTYSADEYDDRHNLLNYLYMCEDLKKSYEKKGISLDILYATLKDIVFYSNAWSEIRNRLCLGEYEWLSRHLSMKLFQLGRLQFYMGRAEHSIPEKDIFEGDNIIEVHIPEGGSFTREDCISSITETKAFFAKYFPDFKYKGFTCDTWLFDTALKDILKPDSNIIRFQNMFDIFHKKESDEILRYIFKWNSTRDNIKDEQCKSGFAQKIKDLALSGGIFYEALGVLKEEFI